MKFEHTDVWGFEHAIRGMRNSYESWEKSDSKFYELDKTGVIGNISLGKNDLELMQKLIKAGPEHRKFLRQIMVSCDITAPLYWWKEFDTYKVGTVANSTSTMHKLASTPITMDCFEYSVDCVVPIFNEYIETLEALRKNYNETKNKEVWKAIIQMLPESWLQKRTVTMNYENLLSMIHQRQHHKLTEWSESFIDWDKTLPYAEELLFLGK